MRQKQILKKVDTSEFAKNTDLANLKSDVEKLELINLKMFLLI